MNHTEHRSEAHGEALARERRPETAPHAIEGLPFVERFRAAWASRDPERLSQLLHPEVVLIQPAVPAARGRDVAVRGLADVLALLPDLEITIHDSMADGDRVFIAFSVRGTVGKRRIELQFVDRIELCDGLVRTRIAYYDPLPLLRAVLFQPRLWRRFIALTWARR